MANPAEVTCTANAWTPVAIGVTSGQIWIKDSGQILLQTYRVTTDPAPTVRGEGVSFQFPGDNISASELSDIYIWADGADAKVRVDL